MFQAPAYLTKARHLFDCVSFTVYRSPYCHTVLNADGRVHTVTYLRLFLSFSSHKFLHLFTFAHPFFFSFLWFLHFFFSSQFSFIPIFTRTSFIALNFILLRSIGRDYLLVCFSFHSSQSSRNVWLLTTHIPRYSPIVVVIMRIMSTLGWCPPKVISSKSQFSFRLIPSPQGASACSPQSSHHNSSYKAEELPPSLGDIIGAFCWKQVPQCPN